MVMPGAVADVHERHGRDQLDADDAEELESRDDADAAVDRPRVGIRAPVQFRRGFPEE